MLLYHLVVRVWPHSGTAVLRLRCIHLGLVHAISLLYKSQPPSILVLAQSASKLERGHNFDLLPCYLHSVDCNRVFRDLSRIWQINLFRKYDCLQSQISNATGTSVCSAEQLCAKDWLFTDIGFGKLGNSANTASLGIYGVGFYLLMVLIAFAFLAPVGLSVYRKMHGNQRRWREFRDTLVLAINIALIAFFWKHSNRSCHVG